MGQRQFYRTGGARQTRQARPGQAPAQNPNLLWQLLPLLIMSAFALLSYLPSLLAPQEPSFAWAPTGQLREQRVTQGKGVAYYVNRREWEGNDLVNGRVANAQAGPRSGLRGFEARVSWQSTAPLIILCRASS